MPTKLGLIERICAYVLWRSGVGVPDVAAYMDDLDEEAMRDAIADMDKSRGERGGW